MSYKAGDYIVFPLHGAGIIKGIVERLVEEKTVSFYDVEFPYGNLKLMVPVDVVDEVGVRRVISPEDVPAVLEYLRTSEVIRSVQNWNKRQRENLGRIRTGDIREVADVYKYLFVRNSDKSLSSGEKKLMISAKKVLLSELHLATGQSVEDVEKLVAEAILGN